MTQDEGTHPRTEAQSIGARLRSHIPQIMETWETWVRREIPAARGAELQVLRNSLPELLEEVAREIVHVQGTEFNRKLHLSRVHGAERAKLPNYSLFEVILEYRILRKTVFIVLEESALLEQRERDIVTDAVEAAMQDAAAEYTAHTQHLMMADRHKSELLAMVAHELRTPLSAVGNALYILENIRLDDRAVRQIVAANRQIRQIARLVDDLMDITSITEGKVALRMAPLTIENIINDSIETVLPLIESRGQELTSSISSHGIVINGDADRLEQIMLNLLNNSSKYTEPGGRICVTLGTEQSEAVIKVNDTGIGIDPPALPQIFDMFHQVAASTHLAEGGVGIGLGVVKRLAELHGGTVSVESQGLGKGTQFTLRLPIFAV
jgi:signal transduction histidine kinase